MDPNLTSLDPAIAEVLPRDVGLVNVQDLGQWGWAKTVCITVKKSNESLASYPVKMIKGDDAAERILGEYKAMREIYETTPSLVPRPKGHGRCHEQADTHVLVYDFLDVDANTQADPDPVALVGKLAQLHKQSTSPTGKFGFHQTTFEGKLPLNTTWESSWTKFFAILLHDVYRLDVVVNGLWKELDDAMRVTLTKLVPRLLNPLSSDGRSIKPSLIHGNLSQANIGTNSRTEEICIFNACSYYAHHEKEIAAWRCKHYNMTDSRYLDEYLKHYGPSEPRAEFEDRNRLYSVETLLMNSAHHPGAATRQLALGELNFLVAKYFPELRR